MRQALEAFGADAATIKAALQERGPLEFPIWPENADALDVLFAMKTQLRTAGLYGRVIGLDYNVLPWVMQQVGVPPDRTAEVFKQLQVAEDALLA